MVVSCWVKGCTNRADPSVKRGFFYIPKVRVHEGEQTHKLTEERRKVWLANLNRKEAPTKSSRICSDHFISGRPSSLYDRSNPDWAPHLKLSNNKDTGKTVVVKTKKKEHQEENQTAEEQHKAAMALIELSSQAGGEDSKPSATVSHTQPKYDNVCVIAVHAGAGYHRKDKEQEYKTVCTTACRLAMHALNSGSTAVEAVSIAIQCLEDSPLTNAGTGSSLTLQGTVECDASIMDGQSLCFGAVGAIHGSKNPILVARKLVEEQQEGNLSLGRIPPCTIVGDGAYLWAREHGIAMVNKEALKTDLSVRTYENHKKRLAEADMKKMMKRRKYLSKDSNIKTIPQPVENSAASECPGVQDTVGAVCIDQTGRMAAGASSGGISLKHPGRIGPAAVYGAGCWAFDWRSDTRPGVAVATSGTGEHLMKTLLARECVQCLQQQDMAAQGLANTLQENFLDSCFLKSSDVKYGGVLAMKHEKSEDGTSLCELLWGHTTDSMCLAYMTNGSRPRAVISRLGPDKEAGKTFVICGSTVSASR